jgi:hypothetical protein
VQPPKWAGKNWVRKGGQWLPPDDKKYHPTPATELSYADYQKNKRIDWDHIWFGKGAAPWTDTWYQEQQAKIPTEWQRRITDTYSRLHKREYDRQANDWLENIAAQMHKLMLPLSATDEEIINTAQKKADECLALVRDSAQGCVTAYEIAARFCMRHHITPPKINDGLVSELSAANNRMTSANWWRLQLRSGHTRAIENCARSLGYVQLHDQKYVSDVNLNRRRKQKKRNQLILERTEITNEAGQVVKLSSAAATNTSNPVIRRIELMTRCKGFEEYAKEQKHAALFITLTTPSHYHSTLSKSGQPNPQWKGETSQEAQQHLVRCWAQCRAQLARFDIKLYGIRVAEPHHDGTPHWHMLMFMPRKALKKTTETFKTYFLTRHSPEERGARENRIKIVGINPRKGSATGYIAKYISKNIDAEGVDKDLDGDDAKTGAERVEAWSSSHRIRQFQQMGGAPVTAWRELRRMNESNQHTQLIAKIRKVADDGSWKEYTTLAGGATCKRREMTIGIAKTRPGMAYDPISNKQVPAMNTQYGEQAPPITWGIRDMTDGLSFQSRYHIWTSKRKRGHRGRESPRITDPWTRENNCTQQQKETQTDLNWVKEYEECLL